MSGGNVLIKNEPIKTEDIDFVTDELFLHNIVIKCERDSFPIPSDFVHDIDDRVATRTIICSESEYLAAGNVSFDSIIVKEEPQFHFSNEPTTTLDVRQFLVKYWECYICRSDLFGNPVELRRHINTHVVDKNSCDQCGRTFYNKQYLKKHKETHKETHKEKRFSCDQCDRKFLRKSILKQHTIIHSGIKPFACSECDKKFSDSSTLYKHKQTHSNERPFACHLCDQRCARKSTLLRHLGTHTGAKAFVCNICEKKFARNSTLNHHKLLHAGTFPFKCDKCDKKFVTKSTLNFHRQTHNLAPLPVKCMECDRSFMTKGRLNIHSKVHNLSKSTGDQKSSKFKQHIDICHVSPKKSGAKKVTKPRTKQKKLSKYTILMNKCKSLRKI